MGVGVDILKQRKTRTVGLGDVVDELHDKHSLADTGTAKQTCPCGSVVWNDKEEAFPH